MDAYTSSKSNKLTKVVCNEVKEKLSNFDVSLSLQIESCYMMLSRRVSFSSASITYCYVMLWKNTWSWLEKGVQSFCWCVDLKNWLAGGFFFIASLLAFNAIVINDFINCWLCLLLLGYTSAMWSKIKTPDSVLVFLLRTIIRSRSVDSALWSGSKWRAVIQPLTSLFLRKILK